MNTNPKNYQTMLENKLKMTEERCRYHVVRCPHCGKLFADSEAYTCKYIDTMTFDTITCAEAFEKTVEANVEGARYTAFMHHVACRDHQYRDYMGTGCTLEETVRNLYINMPYYNEQYPIAYEAKGNHLITVYDREEESKTTLYYDEDLFFHIFSLEHLDFYDNQVQKCLGIYPEQEETKPNP